MLSSLTKKPPMLAIPFTVICLLSMHIAKGEPETPITASTAQTPSPGSGIIPPQWSEFCQGLYCQSSKTQIPDIKERPNAGSVVVGTFIPVLLPALYKKQAEAARSEKAWRQATEHNYWVDRRHQFETELGQCQSVQDHDKQVECYMSLRQMEVSQNQTHQQEALMRQQINAIHSLAPRYNQY